MKALPSLFQAGAGKMKGGNLSVKDHRSQNLTSNMKKAGRSGFSLLALHFWAITMLLMISAGQLVAMGRPVTVQNEHLALGFDLSDGVTVTRIYDRVNNIDYLMGPSSLFEYAVNNGTPYQSNSGTVVEAASFSPDGTGLTINARAVDEPLKFTLYLSAAPGDAAVVLQLSIRNLSNNRIFLRTVLPKMFGVRTANPSRMMGAIPQEIGSVGPLREGVTLGMPFNIGVGLPTETGSNTMEVASIYDQDGRGGVFFADIEGNPDQGVAPIQFTLSSTEVDGFWISYLKPGQEVAAPKLAIGVHHSGDWHAAVDYYVAKHQAAWTFPDTPAWLKEEGAIFSFGGGGAGGIYLGYHPVALKDRISHFSQLPSLLREARTFGTNIVYLWDYWEGLEKCEYIDENKAPYFNKGDYIPRKDMGGNEALAQGIKAVHDDRGKVIMYIEPFIIYPTSIIGRKKGDGWSSYNHFGSPLLDRDAVEIYGGIYKMNAAFVPWQDEVVKIAQRIVGEYGADGIMLDSWGWQMNWAIQSKAEGIKYSPAEYSEAVLKLVDRVRSAVRAIKPDAVVISETTSGPIGRHVDGGFSADLADSGNPQDPLFPWLKNA